MATQNNSRRNSNNKGQSQRLVDILQRNGGSNELSSQLRSRSDSSSPVQGDSLASSLDFFSSSPALQPFGNALKSTSNQVIRNAERNRTEEGSRSLAENLRTAGERTQTNARDALRRGAERQTGADVSDLDPKAEISDSMSLSEVLADMQTIKPSFTPNRSDAAESDDTEGTETQSRQGGRSAQAASTSRSQDTTDTQEPTPEQVASESPIGGRGNTSPEVENSVAKDMQVKNLTGLSASEVLPGGSPPSEASLVNDFLASNKGQNVIERARLEGMNAEATREMALQELEQEYATEKQELNETLAANGLAFSGIRGSQIRSLAENLAQSQLAVDRKFAASLLDADITFRESIMQGVSNLLSEAQKKDEQAMEQLNEAGYAVVGDLVVPSLASKKADQSQMMQQARLNLEAQRVDIARQSEARQMWEAEQREFDRQFDRDMSVADEIRVGSAIEFFQNEDVRNIPESQLVPVAMEQFDISKTEAETLANLRVRPTEQLTQIAAEQIAETILRGDAESYSNFWRSKSNEVSKASQIISEGRSAMRKAAQRNPDAYRNSSERNIVIEYADKVPADDIIDVMKNIDFGGEEINSRARKLAESLEVSFNSN